MLKSSNKTDVNTTELLISIDAEAFEAAVEANDKENVNALFNNAVKKLDQGVKHGILHKNNAARKKSALVKRLNKTEA